MKLPRLKIRKSTRATLSGIMIAIASLYALAMAYEEARDNLLRFFVGALLLVVIVMGGAIAMVALWRILRFLLAKISRNKPEDNGRPQ